MAPMPQARARTKAEQSVATRRKLLSVARRLFATRGYSGTSIDDITRRANVTRGALYHHFSDKGDLFRGVFEEVQDELGVKITAAAAAEAKPEKHLEAGLNAFLDACLDRDVQRIILLDAPSVLGWEAWHEADARHGIGMIMTALSAAMDAGYIERQDPEPLAHLTLGALNEAGLAIARADDVARARRRYGATLGRWVEGLKPGR
jgi:AcrR family transcriptional regulator